MSGWENFVPYKTTSKAVVMSRCLVPINAKGGDRGFFDQMKCIAKISRNISEKSAHEESTPALTVRRLESMKSSLENTLKSAPR